MTDLARLGKLPQRQRYRFSNGPPDMRALLMQLLESWWPAHADRRLRDMLIARAMQFDFPVFLLPLARVPANVFDEVGRDSGDDRNEAWAIGMKGQPLPPVLVAGGTFVDGKHRAWAARALGLPSVAAIDLASMPEIADLLRLQPDHPAPWGLLPDDGGTTGGPRTDWWKRYTTQLDETYTSLGPVQHLRIKRMDGKPIRVGWDTLQQIKNDRLGKDVTAIEVFPAEADVINEANVRHLWVLPENTLPNLMPQRDMTTGQLPKSQYDALRRHLAQGRPRQVQLPGDLGDCRVSDLDRSIIERMAPTGPGPHLRDEVHGDLFRQLSQTLRPIACAWAVDMALDQAAGQEPILVWLWDRTQQAVLAGDDHFGVSRRLYVEVRERFPDFAPLSHPNWLSGSWRLALAEGVSHWMTGTMAVRGGYEPVRFGQMAIPSVDNATLHFVLSLGQIAYAATVLGLGGDDPVRADPGLQQARWPQVQRRFLTCWWSEVTRKLPIADPGLATVSGPADPHDLLVPRRLKVGFPGCEQDCTKLGEHGQAMLRLMHSARAGSRYASVLENLVRTVLPPEALPIALSVGLQQLACRYPQLPPAAGDQLERDVGDWSFEPAVEVVLDALHRWAAEGPSLRVTGALRIVQRTLLTARQYLAAIGQVPGLTEADLSVLHSTLTETYDIALTAAGHRTDGTPAFPARLVAHWLMRAFRGPLRPGDAGRDATEQRAACWFDEVARRVAFETRPLPGPGSPMPVE